MNLLDYAMQGAYHSMGFTPTGVTGTGEIIQEGFGLNVHQGRTIDGKRVGHRRGKVVAPSDAWSKAGGWGKAGILGFHGFQVASTGYALYQGYQEDGISGAYQAGVWDLATNAAVARFAFSSPGHGGGKGSGLLTRGSKLPGTELRTGGTLKYMGRYVGAGIGAAIGQEILGTPGAFIGGYIGAAPLAASAKILSSRGGIAGAAAVAGAAGAYWGGYGAYHVIKAAGQASYGYSQSLRGINTDGDMSAFMTRGAMTMRERAVQAMHKSHLNSRSALGQEANFLHSNRNYHSRYR